MHKFQLIFRSFKSRNFALFFAGQSISQIGTWMQRTAVIWVIYSHTHSAAMIGLAVFVQQFPSFLLSLIGGVVADRISRYKILIITQAASMVQAAMLALLVISGHYLIWQVFALSFLLGVINAFDVPARQPLIHEMIDDKADLANAISLNSAMVNLARLIGPALSGLILQRYGAGVSFALNAISFIAVIVSLLLMKLPKPKITKVPQKILEELKDGLRYLQDTPAIRTLILLQMSLSLFILPYDTLEPVFAKVIFHGNATTYGFVSGCIGLGALVASFILASLDKKVNLRAVLLISVMVLGTGLILFSRMGNYIAAMPFALILGLGSITPMSTSITVIQMEAATAMRGRVMSYVAVAYFGMLPLGSLMISSLSQKFGAPATMLTQGLGAVAISAVFYKYLMKEDQLKNEGETTAAKGSIIHHQ